MLLVIGCRWEPEIHKMLLRCCPEHHIGLGASWLYGDKRALSFLDWLMLALELLRLLLVGMALTPTMHAGERPSSCTLLLGGPHEGVDDYIFVQCIVTRWSSLTRDASPRLADELLGVLHHCELVQPCFSRVVAIRDAGKNKMQIVCFIFWAPVKYVSSLEAWKFSNK